jgi:hypothetical protein
VSGFTDLVERAQRRVAGAGVGSTDAKVTKAYDRERELLKSVDGTGQNPSVPAAGNQSRDEGGRFLSASTGNQTPGGSDYDREVSRPGDWRGNADTEGSRAHGPGSIVQAALDRGRANIASYPGYTVSGAIAEACARHQIQVFGHQKGVQPSVEGAYQSRLMDASSTDDRTWRAYQAALERLVGAFKSSVGRYPTYNPANAEDKKFLIAAARLRNQFWPDGNSDPAADPGGQQNIQ